MVKPPCSNFRVISASVQCQNVYGISETPRLLLASVAEQASSSLTWSYIPKTANFMMWLKCSGVSAVKNLPVLHYSIVFILSGHLGSISLLLVFMNIVQLRASKKRKQYSKILVPRVKMITTSSCNITVSHVQMITLSSCNSTVSRVKMIIMSSCNSTVSHVRMITMSSYNSYVMIVLCPLSK